MFVKSVLRSRDFLHGARAGKPYLVGAGAEAGKNPLKTAPRSRETVPASRTFLEPVK